MDLIAVIQRLFNDIYQQTSFIPIQTNVPASTDGQSGDLILVDSGTSLKLYAKSLAGVWKQVTLS